MMVSLRNNIISFLRKARIPMLLFMLGFFISSFLHRNDGVGKTENDFYQEVANIIEEKYPFQEPNSQEKLYGSIKGLVGAYNDDYTIFFSPKNAKVFKQDVEGSFGGIGLEIGIRDGFLVAISPLKGSPAEKAGVRPGDIILKIDGEDVGEKTMYEVLDAIRGEAGTEVTLSVFRPETEALEDIVIHREVIHVPTLETDAIGDTFVISLYNFNDEAVPLFEKALQAYLTSPQKNLLIDLRGNPGGLLGGAIDTLSYFVEQGKVLVQEDFGDNNGEAGSREERSKGYPLLKEKFPQHLGVVIDSGSASASEIFAGALQDYGIAKIFGEQSFGKGSVQELIPFDNGTSLKVTVARWLTPEGRQISENGITPDVWIEDVSTKSTEELVRIFEEDSTQETHS